MRKDPTEFRERFAKWKAGEKVYENGLPKYGDGTTNVIPEDLQGLSDPQFLPQIDAAKVQMTPFVVDDTAYRALKYHPGITRELVQELYNNTPYIGSYNKGMLARPSVGAYFSDRDDYPFVRIGLNKPYSVKQMIAHESGHALDRKLFGGRTKEERDAVRAAYGNIPGMTDDEMFLFNREVRQAISENNRNAIKEKLDAVLKEIKGKDINWTIKNGKFGHADEAYKANIDPEAVRKALLEVAQNKYTFDKGNGIMLAKNGKSAGLPAYGGGKSTKKGSYYLPGEKIRRELDVSYDDSSYDSKRRYDYKYVQAGKDNGWVRITDDKMSDVFLDFVARPKSRGGNTDTYNWNKQWALKGEPGLEIVSPEFDLLSGIRALTPTISSADRKAYHVMREMNKGLKLNPALKTYNGNVRYLDTGGNVLLYLDYLHQLFPNSKIGDIVYHSTWAKPFEQFDPSKVKRGYGFYFSPSEHHLPFGRMVYAKVNLKKPLRIFPNENQELDVSGLWGKLTTEQAIKKGNHDGVVGVSNMRNPGEPEIVALNPEQVHILGSERDVEGFRKFISKPSVKLSVNADIAKDPYIDAASSVGKTSSDIAKESSTVRELNLAAKIVGGNRIGDAYSKIKSFLNSPQYKKRLEKYYRDKGSSIITQNVAPEDRIGELLYNIETSKLKIMPRGKLVDETGTFNDSFGLYDPNSHSIQIASDATLRLTPEHEMWHASRKARPYLDNEKYSMQTTALREIDDMFEKEFPGEFNSKRIKQLEKDASYYSQMTELEVRVLDTLREMLEAGLDINNLTDDQIWNFLIETPIDLLGTNVQSLIDNYVYDDIKRALRNFKGLIPPTITTGIGYGSYNKYAE